MLPIKRYRTARITCEIPLELQLLLWDCVEQLREGADCLQVFELTSNEGKQQIVHFQEVPRFQKEYWIFSNRPIVAKIYIIIEGEYATMLFADEY